MIDEKYVQQNCRVVVSLLITSQMQTIVGIISLGVIGLAICCRATDSRSYSRR